jgi:uncharacterized protein YdaU (DUF1376 family)
MAARWQQWMPFHIDRWKGSPHVQSMRAAARAGYLYLLTAAWQTDDCSLPSDDDELVVLAGLTEEEWAEYGSKIRRRFAVGADGRLYNAVLRDEWSEAKRVFESRQKSAHRTNTVRSPHDDRTVTEGEPSRSADTRTVTGIDTDTEKQETLALTGPTKSKKQKTSRETREVDPRHAQFRELTGIYWCHKNPALQMPWDGSEAKQLSSLLAANPSLDGDGFKELLNRRSKSQVNHAERPRAWLPKVTDYAGGPLNEFNKPMGGGSANFKGKTESSVDAARAAIEAIEDRAAACGVGSSSANQIGDGGLPDICDGSRALRYG